MATDGIELSGSSRGAHGKSQSLANSTPTTVDADTCMYRAAALRCNVMRRSRREYACAQADGDPRKKLSKAMKRQDKKKKRKLDRKTLPGVATSSNSFLEAAAGGAADTLAISAGLDADGSSTVHVTYEAEVEIVMNTGQYRVVRRLLAAVGLPVLRLRRTAVGCVSLESLAAAGVPLKKPQDVVLLPGPLVDQLWQSVGGAEEVWERRLAALRAQCKGSCSCNGSEMIVAKCEVGNPSIAADADEEERKRLQEWLKEHGLLESNPDF